MKKIVIGIAFLPLFTYAETTIVSEILIGQTQHKIHSSLRTVIQTEVSEKNYSSSLNSDSFGFRLGVKFTHHLTFELAKHKHGSTVNKFTESYPTMGPSGSLLPPEFDTSIQAIIPIDINSIRLGVKGEVELFKDFSINARLGFAHWKYDGFTPQKLTHLGVSSYGDESGNDIYYSLGAEYKFTENFYVGLEHSLLKINQKNGINNEVRASYKHDVKDLSLVLGWVF